MATLEFVSDAAVSLDRHGNYLSINRAAAELFRQWGHDPATMLGRSVWNLFPGIKGTTAERHLRSAIEDEVPINSEFYDPLHQRWYKVEGFPSSPGVILIVRDITSIKTSQNGAPSRV